ncbi:hypothetical protein, partial [Vibrio cholerae]|uniref:hypothetical protein n=2 Tax=Vibrio cholerae TaxID=666 RepID=UPI002F3540A5
CFLRRALCFRVPWFTIVRVKIMFNTIRKKYVIRIFFFSVLLFVVQVGLFSDVNKGLESKEFSYNYQLDRWQSTFTFGWRELVSKLRESGLVLCDDDGIVSKPHIQLLDTYYYSMYDLHLTSKYKFHVSTYIFNDINHLYSILSKYPLITKLIISNEDLDRLGKMLVAYKKAFENSSKLHDEVESNLEQLNNIHRIGDAEIIYKKICSPKTHFFNEESMSVVNELNNITYEVLDNYQTIYNAYIKLANYLMAIKLWLTIMLFLSIQWYVMRKDVET